MVNSIPIETADNFEYIHRPLTLARREKFLQVVSRVRGGRVLDLGCGYTGHYWAMGYLSRAESISFYDAVSENISLQSQTIEQLSPDYIEAHLSDTVDFLKAHKLLPDEWDYSAIASNLIEKIEQILVFDFAKDTPNSKFDTVLALESLEIAESQLELERSCATAHALLKPGGQLIGLALPYTELLPQTAEAIALRREGSLNPDSQQLESALKLAGFEVSYLKQYETGTPNYPIGIAFEAISRY